MHHRRPVSLCWHEVRQTMTGIMVWLILRQVACSCGFHLEEFVGDGIDLNISRPNLHSTCNIPNSQIDVNVRR